jgi:dihydrolipoamide dehydrogenase
MADQYDVIVIGAGPAGYVAAIRAAQLGYRVACIDQWQNAGGVAVPGGTCLNVGCIPSKALLESSHRYLQISDALSDHGIRVAGVELDLAAMMARKERIVKELTQGIEQLFKANGVEWIKGTARLAANKQVEVSAADARESVTLAGEHVILAPGSSPVTMEQVPLLEGRVVDSSGALEFEEVPQRLGIIGAGAIGLELGSVWRRLGAQNVTLLEAQESFLTMADRQVAAQAMRSFKRQGLDIQLDSRVLSCSNNGTGLEIEYRNPDGSHRVEFDKLIVAVGRRPNTHNLADAEAELLLDEWGFIHVDEQCRTNLPGVYAIGDAVRGPMLAHKGSEEGIMVAELIAGQAARVDYAAVPSVIYTQPEIAWVGETEQSLQARGTAYRSGMFPFAASGRARAHGDTEGFIKLLADADTDRVVGVHMIGPDCSELISQAVIAMRLGASAEDIALTMFAHPTLSESFHEAAFAAHGRPIHVFQRGKKT